MLLNSPVAMETLEETSALWKPLYGGLGGERWGKHSHEEGFSVSAFLWGDFHVDVIWAQFWDTRIILS